jgi:hypothetical protein
MARKPTKAALSAQSLEALGATRLAEILMELGDGDAGIKRRLKLELAANASPQEAEREIAKRLATIGRSRSYIEWHNAKAFAADLDQQRKAIVGQVAKASPVLGLGLMWRFLGLADSVFARCDDSNGTISSVFQAAVSDVGPIALAAKVDPETLAGDVLAQLKTSDYGHRDELIATLAPALGSDGLIALKRLVEAYGAEKREQPAKNDRRVIGWGSGGEIYADEIEERSRQSTVRHALLQIADALGDVDAFAAQYSAEARRVPGIAAEIALRLLAAGRADEALTMLDRADRRRTNAPFPEFDWDDARIAVLEALGRKDEAQAVRWACFAGFLSTGHLRAYLKQLPDFDDVEAERRAMDLATSFRSVHHALHFLVEWPDLERAARLVATRAKELDGDFYAVLSPAADALSGRYPLAATRLLRLMIDHTLDQAKSSRYKHAARHLLECQSLAGTIASFDPLEPHAEYLARLKKDHGRKSGFWSLVT